MANIFASFGELRVFTGFEDHVQFCRVLHAHCIHLFTGESIEVNKVASGFGSDLPARIDIGIAFVDRFAVFENAQCGLGTEYRNHAGK